MSLSDHSVAVTTAPLPRSRLKPRRKRFRPGKDARVIAVQDMQAILYEAQRDKTLTGLRNTALMLTMLVSGLRISEALSLKIEQVHDGIQIRDRFFLPRANAKGKQHDRTAPMRDRHNELRRALMQYLDLRRRTGGGRLDLSAPLFPSPRLAKDGTAVALHRSEFNRTFTRWQRAAGILFPYRVHDIRHTAVSRFYQASQHDLKATQQFSGHRRAETLMKYVHPDSDDICRVSATISVT